MTGHWLRMNRLFSEGKNAVVVAVDHGEFFGPTPGIVDLPGCINDIACEADAVLIAPGMMAHCGSVFSRRGAPLAIVRLNWNTVYCVQWGYEDTQGAWVVSPQEALALGADLGLASLNLTTDSAQADGRAVELFARLVAEKRRCGLPLIAEVFPPASDRLTPGQLHERVLIGCRMVAELGADAVKTFYTGEDFGQVVESTPIPVLALGAERRDTVLEALELASQAVQAGARGVVFGRNVFQAPEPARFLEALKAVVKQGQSPREAAANAGLAL